MKRGKNEESGQASKQASSKTTKEGSRKGMSECIIRD